MIYKQLRLINKPNYWLIFFMFFFIAHLVNAQVLNANDDKTRQHYLDLLDNIKLKNKIIPLNNTVYQFLDYLEATGKIEFLPQAKPYTKIEILKMLVFVYSNYWLTVNEKEVIDNYLNDFVRESNGFQLFKQETINTVTIIGISADATAHGGIGKNGTYSTSLIGLPYLSGDLGNHISFNAAIGGSIERLAPDLFYQSYTKDGQVNFPYDQIGYTCLPYQFNYETLFAHVLHKDKWVISPNINKELGLGMIYYTEMNASWFDGVIQLSLNNQRRAWGHDNQNLVLSSTARRFSGFEFKINPATWLRYSMLTGSLFNSSALLSNKNNIYGEDKGLLENLYTLHLLEFTPNDWLQVSATAATIWWKRLELNYLMPLTYSNFSQIEVGDYDNNTMSVDVAFRIPGAGKAWLSFFNDEFSFIKSGPLLKMPRNRYAWQFGYKTSLLSNFIPGTSATLKYTRLTPFVYTHYTEKRINIYDGRPLDMTYTHDGFNLGFYLPPNSGELNLTLINVNIPDLILTLDNKLIIHGTNDLSDANVYQIYGDIYKDQTGEVDQYPYMNFTKDGIYDWTVMSDFKFDYKIRGGKGLNYYRVVGSLGFAGTWWQVNNSGITSPGSRSMLCGSLGVIIDM
jgi:hypothetical protein